jgi:hypothetical protein
MYKGATPPALSTWQRCYMELTKPEGIPHLKDISLPECRIAGNRLYFRDRLYVPDTELRLLLLQLAHDSVETGHPDKNKLYVLLVLPITDTLSATQPNHGTNCNDWPAIGQFMRSQPCRTVPRLSRDCSSAESTLNLASIQPLMIQVDK